MSAIEIRKISITALKADAIVNAANEGLRAGGGVCGAIFKAAGYARLQDACDKIGHCHTGSAVITPGYKLAKYIIHAVGPVYIDGKHNEGRLLYGAYKSALELAMNRRCHSIGFPLISAGIFGYPADEAWKKAIEACNDFIVANPDYDLNIIFAVLDQNIMKCGINTLDSVVNRTEGARKSDWKVQDMPEIYDVFVLNRTFTRGQVQILRNGHIPEGMEDEWFCYMEGNTLYVHRSWNGFCIYIMELVSGNSQKVKVNRDPEQYSNKNIDEDRAILNRILNELIGAAPADQA